MLVWHRLKECRRGRTLGEQKVAMRHFPPLVQSVDGVLTREARFVKKCFADRLATKWSRPYPEVTGWVKTRLSSATLHATNRSSRGSKKWTRLGGWGRAGTGYAVNCSLCFVHLCSYFPICVFFYQLPACRKLIEKDTNGKVATVRCQSFSTIYGNMKLPIQQ